MKLLRTFVLLLCLTATSCTMVPTDFMPKPTWYWSEDAKRARKGQSADW